MTRLAWLRFGDAAVGWLAALVVVRGALPFLPPQASLVLATVVVVAVGLIPRLRLAWRPLSGITMYVISSELRPGDRAWFVHGRDANLVLVTARHALRIVIARPGHDAAEGMSVRRTRVLLLPTSRSA